MKVTKEKQAFAPINIKLETLKEYIILHDLLCFCQDENVPSHLERYIENGENSSRPIIQFHDIDNVITDLQDKLYKVRNK